MSATGADERGRSGDGALFNARYIDGARLLVRRSNSAHVQRGQRIRRWDRLCGTGRALVLGA